MVNSVAGAAVGSEFVPPTMVKSMSEAVMYAAANRQRAGSTPVGSSSVEQMHQQRLETVTAAAVATTTLELPGTLELEENQSTVGHDKGEWVKEITGSGNGNQSQ